MADIDRGGAGEVGGALMVPPDGRARPGQREPNPWASRSEEMSRATLAAGSVVRTILTSRQTAERLLFPCVTNGVSSQPEISLSHMRCDTSSGHTVLSRTTSWPAPSSAALVFPSEEVRQAPPPPTRLPPPIQQLKKKKKNTKLGRAFLQHKLVRSEA